MDRINTKFPGAVFSTDVEKGISRPSFFVDFDNIKSTDFMREAQDRELTVRIYYFSTTIDNNKLELLEMQDDLTEIFLKDNLIEVNEDIKIEIDEIDIDTVDKVLHCYFDIRISENYKRIDDKPLMEDLEVENL